MTVNLETEQGRLVLFLILHILGGHVGIPLILLTIFASRQLMRHPVFINFCVTWMCFSSSYLLLSVIPMFCPGLTTACMSNLIFDYRFYAGQIENLYPTFGLCVIQAAMIYASVAMVGISSLVFGLHVSRRSQCPNRRLMYD
jgi:hypothetical protein